MASVRSKWGKLFLDFRWRGRRCREFTGLSDTKDNRRRAEAFLKVIQGQIALGTFDYRMHFPNGTRRVLPASVRDGSAGPAVSSSADEEAKRWHDEEAAERSGRKRCEGGSSGGVKRAGRESACPRSFGALRWSLQTITAPTGSPTSLG